MMRPSNKLQVRDHDDGGGRGSVGGPKAAALSLLVVWQRHSSAQRVPLSQFYLVCYCVFAS